MPIGLTLGCFSTHTVLRAASRARLPRCFRSYELPLVYFHVRAQSIVNNSIWIVVSLLTIN